MPEESFQNLFNGASVGIALLVFVVLVTRNFIQKRDERLENILARVLAASSLPTGFVLLLCAFDPSLIASLVGLNIHIALAGMALLYISGRTLFRDENLKIDVHQKEKRHTKEKKDKAV